MEGTAKGLEENMRTWNIGRINQKGSRTCECCGSTVPVLERVDGHGDVSEESTCLYCVTQETKSQIPYKEDIKKEKVKDFGNRFSKIPGKLVGKTVSEYTPESESEQDMRQSAIDFIQQFGEQDHHSLVFKGPMGVGKSHLASAIATEIRRRSYSVMYIAADDFLKLIKSTFDNNTSLSEYQIFEMIESLDLLVFDEIGAEYNNKKDSFETWASEKILKLTDLREDKATIYTTNYSAPEMEEKYGPIQGGRIASRMIAGAKVIQVEGRDRRQQAF